MPSRVCFGPRADPIRKIIYQNEKISALGELQARVAHELNSPLLVAVVAASDTRPSSGLAGYSTIETRPPAFFVQ